MKPRSQKNPGGFDYQNQIQVLSGDFLTLPGGETIEVLSTQIPTEAKNETLLYSKELNALFASDLAYNGVHLWLAGGVDSAAIENWQSELKSLKAQYSSLKVKVYPGHGKPTDTNIFDVDTKYMRDFLAIVRRSKTQEEARASMIKKYPTWKEADFILIQSIKSQFGLLKK
jgi:glyoxylase-like metal-dependent hydrolase (beta-lactamase superfamily II)